MKVLIANIGSTSFKYRLFDMPAEAQLARGGIERIGAEESRCFVEIGEERLEQTEHVPDHGRAVEMCFAQLSGDEGCLASIDEVSAIGFKVVHAGSLSGVRLVDDELLAKLDDLGDVAPAHNPPYAKAMRQVRESFPALPLVAALETGFHDTIPEANRIYAVPYEWKERHEVQRWGFHGASHRYVTGRITELMGRTGLRVVSCHLGGSSSLCASLDGKSVATSMGESPQSGLPQNNRVGDFDPFALPWLMKKTGKSLGALLAELGSQSGLLGISGVSGDVRDLREAAAGGNERAQLALNHFVFAIRSYLGAYLVELGGADAIVFTGGIGENDATLRAAVCRDLGWAGIRLQADLNTSASGEARISTLDSDVDVWIVPTNEELVLARQSVELLGA